MDRARVDRLSHLKPGASTSVTKTLTEADVALFLAICGDMHPVYQNHVLAGQSEFGGRILPASLLIGMVSAAMAEMGARLPPPGAVSYRYTLEQKAPVSAGDTVTATLTVAELKPERYEAVVQAEVVNQHGHRVMAGANIMKVI